MDNNMQDSEQLRQARAFTFGNRKARRQIAKKNKFIKKGLWKEANQKARMIRREAVEQSIQQIESTLPSVGEIQLDNGLGDEL